MKSTRRQLHEKAPMMKLLGESYKEKATRRKLQREGHEETATSEGTENDATR